MKYQRINVCLKITTFLLVALSLVQFQACEEKMKPPISGIGASHGLPTQESWNAKIEFTDSGKITGILYAGYIAIYADHKYTLLDSGITIDFFDKEQNNTSKLTAIRGKVNDLTHNLEAYDNVMVVSAKGTTLKTERLYWNNANQKVHTDDFVKIISATEHIEGHGFESDQGLNYYRIFRVTARVQIKE